MRIAIDQTPVSPFQPRNLHVLLRSRVISASRGLSPGIDREIRTRSPHIRALYSQFPLMLYGDQRPPFNILQRGSSNRRGEFETDFQRADAPRVRVSSAKHASISREALVPRLPHIRNRAQIPTIKAIRHSKATSFLSRERIGGGETKCAVSRLRRPRRGIDVYISPPNELAEPGR